MRRRQRCWHPGINDFVDPAAPNVLQFGRHSEGVQGFETHGADLFCGTEMHRHQVDGRFVDSNVGIERLERRVPGDGKGEDIPLGLPSDLASINHGDAAQAGGSEFERI